MVSRAFLRISLATIIIVYCSNFQGYNETVINNLLESSAQPWLSEFFHTQQSLLFAWSFFSSAWRFARIPGIFFAVVLSDKIGRKWTTSIGCCFFAIGSLLTSTVKLSHSYWMAVLGRLSVGFAGGVVKTASSLWLIESAPLNKRGFFASFSLAGAGLGSLTAFILTLPEFLGTQSLWPIATGVSCFPILFLLPLIILYLKESPRYLYLRRNEQQAAKESLEFYQDSEHVDETLEDLSQEAERHTETVSCIDLIWKNRRLRRAFRLCLILNMKCLLGAVPMHVYSTELFHLAGLSYPTSALCTVIAVVPRIILGFIVPFYIDKIGRRPLLIVGAVGYLFCLIILVIVFVFTSPSARRGYIIAVVSCICWCFDAAFEHNVAASELMPQKARAKAVGICTILANFVFAVQVLLALPMYHTIGVPLTLSVFVFNTIVWLAYLYRKLPETKMRTFDQIARVFDEEEEQPLIN